MSLSELVVGRAYVLRGLKDDPKNDKTKARPPAIGKLVSFLPGGVPFVRLLMAQTFFGRKWAPKGRRVQLHNIEREATARELFAGMPLSPEAAS